MKYLYDYECEKKNLSTRNELDAAIEGNKREGRRASGQYDAQAALAMVDINFKIFIKIKTVWTPCQQFNFLGALGFRLSVRSANCN